MLKVKSQMLNIIYIWKQYNRKHFFSKTPAEKESIQRYSCLDRQRCHSWKFETKYDSPKKEKSNKISTLQSHYLIGN